MKPRASHYRKAEPARLSQRQIEILKLVAEGRTNAEIGSRLGITLDGAKWHIREIILKLGATSREDAVARWRLSKEGESWPDRIFRAVWGHLPAALQFSRVHLLPVSALAAGAVGLSLAALVMSNIGRGPAAPLAPIEQASRYPRDASDVVAVAITEEDYPVAGWLKPLPLRPRNAREVLTISSVLDMLPDEDGETLNPAEPYIWGIPRLQIMLLDGMVTVGPAADCEVSPNQRGGPTVCQPIAGSVDILLQKAAQPVEFRRFSDARLWSWLTSGWQPAFELGDQETFNQSWDDLLRTPTP